MAYHVLNCIAANFFADSTDQSYYFRTSFTGATANTTTTLSFVQNADQTVTIPDLSGTVSKADTLLVAGNSGITQSVTGFTISNSVISSLTTPLTVANGGTGLSTFPTGSVLIGNGSSTLSTVSLAANQVLMGTAGAPVAGTISSGTGGKVSFPTASSITIGSYMAPALSKTSLTTSFTNSASSVNFLTSGTLVGSNAIAANTLAPGDVIYISVCGAIQVGATSVITLTLSYGLTGTPNTLHTQVITLNVLATYFLYIKAFVVCGGTTLANQAAGQIQAYAYTGSASFITAPYVAPAAPFSFAYSTNSTTVSLSYTSTGTFTYTPRLTNVYIVKAS